MGFFGLFGPSSEEIRAEERTRAAQETRRQREYEEAKIERIQAENDAKREEEKLEAKEQEAARRQHEKEKEAKLERQHQLRMEEQQARNKEQREEERRRREEMEQRYKQEQEQRKREEACRKQEREDAAEKEREIRHELHSRDQEHAQNMMKMQGEMHKASLQAQKDKEEQIRAERIAQQQMTEKQLAEMREIHKSDLEFSQTKHTEMMKLMTDQIQNQKEQNEKLMANMTVLLEQFSQSRNDFLSYVAEKPQQDIVIPENMEETMRKAKEELGLDTKNCYNFAFVGQTKTGKSSLINALRGIEDTHISAAPVGITECTQMTKPYSFPDPKYKHVKIYDIPGAGTITHNTDSYYQDKHLCAFDCLIICTQDTLGQAEIDFALESLRYNQPIAFVRSRCDVVMDNAKKKKEIKNIDQNAVVAYLNDMSKFYIEEIERTKKPELSRVPCFFVSAYTLRDLIQNEEPGAVYNEKDFLDYIQSKSRFSRNIIQ